MLIPNKAQSASSVSINSTRVECSTGYLLVNLFSIIELAQIIKFIALPVTGRLRLSALAIRLYNASVRNPYFTNQTPSSHSCHRRVVDVSPEVLNEIDAALEQYHSQSSSNSTTVSLQVLCTKFSCSVVYTNFIYITMRRFDPEGSLSGKYSKVFAPTKSAN